MATGVRTTREQSAVLTFVTGGGWSVEDLARFIAAIETAYGLLLALRWVFQESESLDQRRDSYFIAMELRQHLGQSSYPINSLSPFAALRTYPAQQLWLLTELRERLYPRVPRSIGDPERVRLRVRAVRMESPGFISFEGLGDLIQGLRDLVKDVAWRNTHERQMAGVELARAQIGAAREYLAFKREYNQLVSETVPTGVDPTTILVAGTIHELGDLEEAEKLLRRPDALDKLPNEIDE